MKKQVSRAFGKTIYLLGIDGNGTKYWLEEATFDCGWYWGLGYVETYTNNRNPKLSRDINSHEHFDTKFLKHYQDFDNFFEKTVLNEKETWQLLELMKSAYIMREYSDTLHRGGAHLTQNPCKDIIQNLDEYTRINTKVIPAIMNQVYKLLGKED